MVGPNNHTHEHEYRREPDTVYFEDGAFIIAYGCLYSEGKTYFDDARDETYYDERYKCSDRKQERLNLARVSIVTDSDSETTETTTIGRAPPNNRPLDATQLDPARKHLGMPAEDAWLLVNEASYALARDLPGDDVEVDGGLYAAERINSDRTTIHQADQPVVADVTLAADTVEHSIGINEQLTIRLEYGSLD